LKRPARTVPDRFTEPQRRAGGTLDRLGSAEPGPPAERLLGRPEFAGDVAQAGAWVRGRRVLVTGAAGSIGWPLIRRLAALEPAALVLLDHHEYSLFNLERSLAGAGAAVDCQLADLRDARTVSRVFERTAPEVVVHLAAAKHVPYGERFPEATVALNVLATARLLDLAGSVDTTTFIYPSSDKSVDPPSLYGATKRLGEALVQSAARGRSWYVVRYVNIIGTRGSVIETFVQQIRDERPLSVTDERMTRYWISMDEALWLLLASPRREPGCVVMPECGAPVPVVETARRLAGWYRPERDPYPMVVTGIRPGERLDEVLLSGNERFEPDRVQGIRVVRTTRDPACLERVGGVVAELRALIERGEPERLRETAMSAALELQ
jgi:FlaA1/EpsC-like NDP-sugar epimerase